MDVVSDREIARLVQQLGVESQRTGGVLLVDDEPLNLRVLTEFLTDRWTVHEAASGPQGLDVALKVPLDVVIADHRMPGMSGVEMLAELRQRRPDIAGIVLTGFADMQALESAINRAAVFRFLRKPSDPADIIDALEQATAFVVQRRTIEKLVQLLASRNEELRAQGEMLLHLDRLGTIGKLAAGVTHDLRNLMVAFRALDWEVKKITVPPALAEIVTLGLAGVENMVRTLGTVHEFARTGKLSLDLESVDPSAFVGDAISITRMDREFKLREVTCDVPKGLPAVRCDRQKLTQVVVNLLRNALHATAPDGNVRVSAVARRDDVVVAVEDDGPGIPGDLRASLFQPFTSTKGQQGLGLGLYMARLIVVSHHGTIDLVDRARGTRFEVVIPAMVLGTPVSSGGPQG